MQESLKDRCYIKTCYPAIYPDWEVVSQDYLDKAEIALEFNKVLFHERAIRSGYLYLYTPEDAQQIVNYLERRTGFEYQMVTPNFAISIYREHTVCPIIKTVGCKPHWSEFEIDMQHCHCCGWPQC